MIIAVVIIICYLASYILLLKNIGNYEPFYNRDHLLRTFTLLVAIDLFILGVFVSMCNFIGTNASQLICFVAGLWYDAFGATMTLNVLCVNSVLPLATYIFYNISFLFCDVTKKYLL